HPLVTAVHVLIPRPSVPQTTSKHPRAASYDESFARARYFVSPRPHMHDFREGKRLFLEVIVFGRLSPCLLSSPRSESSSPARRSSHSRYRCVWACCCLLRVVPRCIWCRFRRRRIDLAEVDAGPVLELLRLLEADASRFRQLLHVRLGDDLLHRRVTALIERR